MKYSKQRELIYHCVKENPLHLTADAIYARLRKDHPNLSLGTVYRNLSQLVEHHMIRKISTPGEPDRFDGTLENHYHFHCTECGKVQDLFIDELDAIGGIVENQAKVSIQLVEMSFKGICSDCSNIEVS